jgi:tripartite-type tricarboxylate transporter receptor subunit TctC
MAAAPLAVNGHLYKNLKFDVLTSFAPISQVMAAPSILAVPPATPAKTMAELIALARKEPGKLSFSSSGAGGTQHLAGELFQQKADLKLIHIPYKGASPALNDLLGGTGVDGFHDLFGFCALLQRWSFAAVGSGLGQAPAAVTRCADHGRGRSCGS